MALKATLVSLILGAGLALAQAPAAPATSLQAGTRIHAELKSKLDTQHAKVGDQVTAVTTSDVKEGGVKILPKGAKLTGHVTEVVAAESKKSPSHISVLFDQAVTKKGERIALRAGIVSVFTPRPNPAMNPGMSDMPGMAMPSPQPMPQEGGAGPALGNVARAADAVDEPINAASSAGNHAMTLGDQPVPAIVTESNGEIASMARASNGSPIQVVMPSASAQANGQARMGSEISTPRGNLKLDSGTEIELQVMH